MKKQQLSGFTRLGLLSKEMLDFLSNSLSTTPGDFFRDSRSNLRTLKMAEFWGSASAPLLLR